MNPLRLALYYHTLRYLRPVQVSNRIFRRLPRPLRTPNLTIRERRGQWIEPVAFSPASLSRPCRLRDYMSHYHYGVGEDVIREWIQTVPAGSGAAWEPYPVSLRVVNWIKWLLRGGRPSPSILASLATQADRLSNSLEFHLLGNHFLANLKALVFAGTFFEAGRWLRKAVPLLERELDEQILEDGGHFERSPMYHSLVCEDLLDLVNLAEAYPGLLPDFRPRAARLLGWLNRMVHPDGEVSFFNDATFGMAPAPADLVGYASRLGIAAGAQPLGASGYVRLAQGDSVILFDAGAIGPDYQPGHAHCDTLSFEWSHGKRRLIVNSGISTYENSSVRWRERGTGAHNTARIDSQEQSEIWGAFRVARRARVHDFRTDGKTFVEASHDGYTRLRPAVVHHRRLECDGDSVRTIDTFRGTSSHKIEIFFHCHPEADVMIELDRRLDRRVEKTAYHPRFEVSVPMTTISGTYSGPLPAIFTTELHQR